jgi:selenocysteine lyase/cysteine desulfurase
VLCGTASQTRFAFAASGNLRAEGTDEIATGRLFLSQDEDIHLIANYGTTPLCTLHVYSPPLTRMTQYRFDTAERALYEPGSLPLASVAAALAAPVGAPRSIYFNHAATTWPKPEPVYEAINRTLRAAGSLGRTAGTNVDSPLEEARGKIARFLGIADATRLAFVPGCTYAANIAIQNLGWRRGDRLLMSSLEHNAVSRPVQLVAERFGVEYACAPYRPGEPFDLDWAEQELRRGKVRLVVAMMASNVTGEILPYRELRELTRRHGALLMLDAAQAGGVLPLSMRELGPDLCILAGHKGLYGPTGTGLLYVAPGLDQQLFVVGGTGKDSGRVEMSRRMPDQFEVGTHNAMALAGLEAGVEWLAGVGVERILAHERALAARFLAGIQRRDDVEVYGTPDVARRLGVVSVRFIGRDPRDVGGWLAERGVVTRAGFHCAPLAHQTIGSHPWGGTVRFSFGWTNTAAEVDTVVALLDELHAAVPTRPPPAGFAPEAVDAES